MSTGRLVVLATVVIASVGGEGVSVSTFADSPGVVDVNGREEIGQIVSTGKAVDIAATSFSGGFEPKTSVAVVDGSTAIVGKNIPGLPGKKLTLMARKLTNSVVASRNNQKR